MCYLPHHRETTWQSCTTPVVAHTPLLLLGRRLAGEKVSNALSNLQSLHTLECNDDCNCPDFSRHLACIPLKNLRILNSSAPEVIEALSTSDPPVQLKELWVTWRYGNKFPLLPNYLARATSLTHLSLAHLRLSESNGPPPPLYSPPSRLHYLRIHVVLAPRFADQPLKEMGIDTECKKWGELMPKVRQHWQGTVFPHVEDLVVDRLCKELEGIPIEIWREFCRVLKLCAKRRWFFNLIRTFFFFP